MMGGHAGKKTAKVKKMVDLTASCSPYQGEERNGVSISRPQIWVVVATQLLVG